MKTRVSLRYFVSYCRFKAFSKNVNTMNFKTFPTHDGVCQFEGKYSKYSGEKEIPKEFLKL